MTQDYTKENICRREVSGLANRPTLRFCRDTLSQSCRISRSTCLTVQGVHMHYVMGLSYFASSPCTL